MTPSPLRDFLRGAPPRPNGHLYHVTFSGRVRGIAARGLLPAGGGGVPGIGAHHAAHKRRGVFLSAPEGVLFWMGRAEVWAEHYCDRPLSEGLVPVCLRTSDDCGPLEEDDVGSADARAPAWVAPAIPPEALEAWDGGAWVGLDEWEDSAAEAGVQVEDADPEDGGEPLEWLRPASSSPLTPPDAR